MEHLDTELKRIIDVMASRLGRGGNLRVMITGGRGFVGSYLSDTLAESGAEVLVTDVPACDVTDAETIRATVGGFCPELAFHLAARPTIKDSVTDPHATWQTNVIGTSALLEALRREAPTCRVLVVSSAAVYGSPRESHLCKEDDELAPKSPYASSKLATELVAHSYFRDFGLSVLIARPFNLIGPKQSMDYVVPSLTARVLNLRNSSRSVLEVVNLDAIRDFVDVRDAVRAMAAIARHGRAGDTYNICSGEGTSIRELAESLVDLVGVNAIVKESNESGRNRERSSLVGDPEKLREIVDWKIKISFSATLAGVVASMRTTQNCT